MKSKTPSRLRDRMLLIILGLIILGGVFWIHMQQSAFASTAQTTTGTVIELVKVSSKNKGYYPVIQFIIPGEQVYTFRGTTIDNSEPYQVGDQVEILYNPQSPDQAVIAADNSFASNRLMQLFAGVGVMLVIFGGLPFAKRLRERREHAQIAHNNISTPTRG